MTIPVSGTALFHILPAYPSCDALPLRQRKKPKVRTISRPVGQRQNLARHRVLGPSPVRKGSEKES